MVGPSDAELELLPKARDRAIRTCEGWLAAQLGSLGKSLSEVTADPRGAEISRLLPATTPARGLGT